MEPFIGFIGMFGGNFAPRGWALCDGNLLSISENQALFSILGTTYGGDGRTTFGLPDMRGRVPMHPGSGPGLTTRRLGEKGGAEDVVLTINQMPSHNHVATLRSIEEDADQSEAAGNTLANHTGYYNGTPDASLNAGSITVANNGGGQHHTNVQPFICVNYIIALVGTYPSRN